MGECVCSVMSDFSRPHGLQPDRFLYAWNSPGKGVGCHSLLQGIFLTQGSNQGLPHCRQTLPHCRQTLYCWSHQGSPVNTRPPGNFPIFLLLCLLSVFLHWHVSPQGRGLCGLLGSLLCPQHFAWDLVYNRCSISSY